MILTNTFSTVQVTVRRIDFCHRTHWNPCLAITTVLVLIAGYEYKVNPQQSTVWKQLLHSNATLCSKSLKQMRPVQIKVGNPSDWLGRWEILLEVLLALSLVTTSMLVNSFQALHHSFDSWEKRGLVPASWSWSLSPFQSQQDNGKWPSACLLTVN